MRTYHQRYNDLLKRTADSPNDHYSVLISLQEFERRLELIDHLRAWDTRTMLGAEIVMVISVIGLDVSGRSMFLLIMIFGFLIACLFYTRTSYAILDTSTWARQQLELLTIQMSGRDSRP